MAYNEKDWIKNPNLSGYSDLGRLGGADSPNLYRDSTGNYFQGDKNQVRQVGANEVWGNQDISEIGAKRYGDQMQVRIPAEQEQLAKEFRANVPKYTGLLQDQSTKTIQRGLAEKISGLKQKSSNSGFLGGSGTKKQQAEEIGSSEADILSKNMDIEDAVGKQAQQFENQALATKLSLSGAANQQAIDNLRQNILDQQRQTELWKALGSAAGSGVGAYYGRNSGST